jgi:ABC-type branched-subunit amino acid transport system substrate-binding protein
LFAGAITDLFASVTAEGPTIALAWRIATKQLNDLLASIKAPFFITLHVEDTRSDPELALAALQKLQGLGVKVFVGPATSAELSPQVQDFITRNDLIVISNGASATSLQLVDNIYRLVPSDEISGRNLALYALRRAFSKLIVLYRNDNYGKSYNTVLTSTIASSTTPIPVISLPYNADGSDLNAVLASANAQAGTGKVGVVMVTLDEWKDIFVSGAALSSLSKATWLGVELKDSSALPVLVADAAKTTELLDISQLLPSNPLKDQLITSFQSLLVTDVSSFSFVSYDSIFVAFFSFLLPRSTENPNYKLALEYVADSLYLSTQRVAFDRFGDRLLDSEFVFDKVVGSQWTVVTTFANGVWTDLKL